MCNQSKRERKTEKDTKVERERVGKRERAERRTSANKLPRKSVFFSPSVYDVVNGFARLEEAKREAGTFTNKTIFVLQQLH